MQIAIAEPEAYLPDHHSNGGIDQSLFMKPVEGIVRCNPLHCDHRRLSAVERDRELLWVYTAPIPLIYPQKDEKSPFFYENMEAVGIL